MVSVDFEGHTSIADGTAADVTIVVDAVRPVGTWAIETVVFVPVFVTGIDTRPVLETVASDGSAVDHTTFVVTSAVLPSE